jgi:hypothetical protein
VRPLLLHSLQRCLLLGRQPGLLGGLLGGKLHNKLLLLRAQVWRKVVWIMHRHCLLHRRLWPWLRHRQGPLRTHVLLLHVHWLVLRRGLRSGRSRCSGRQRLQILCHSFNHGLVLQVLQQQPAPGRHQEHTAA